MTTSTLINESSERIPTTKNKIFWAIQKKLVQVFQIFEGHLLIGVCDHEGIGSAFGRIEANTLSLELFGYSGRIGINTEEMNFLRQNALKCYQDHEVTYDKYSLMDFEE